MNRRVYDLHCPVDFTDGTGNFGSAPAAAQFPNTGSTVANLWADRLVATSHLETCQQELDRARLAAAKAEQAHKLATSHLEQVEGDLAAVVCGSGRAHVVGDFVVAPRYTGGSLLEAIISDGTPQVVIYPLGAPAP